MLRTGITGPETASLLTVKMEEGKKKKRDKKKKKRVQTEWPVLSAQSCREP